MVVFMVMVAVVVAVMVLAMHGLLSTQSACR